MEKRHSEPKQVGDIAKDLLNLIQSARSAELFKK